MDEVSSYVGLDLLFVCRQGRPIDCSTSPSNPMMEGPQCRLRREARARERHQHPSGGWLEVLDPKRPIREADIPACRRWADSVARRFLVLERRTAFSHQARIENFE